MNELKNAVEVVKRVLLNDMGIDEETELAAQAILTALRDAGMLMNKQDEPWTCENCMITWPRKDTILPKNKVAFPLCPKCTNYLMPKELFEKIQLQKQLKESKEEIAKLRDALHELNQECKEPRR